MAPPRRECDGNKLFVFAWHYHDEDLPGPTADKNLLRTAQQAQLVQYRIDHDHSNAYTAWQKMGSPKEPMPQQYVELERAGHPETIGNPKTININAGVANVSLGLPRQGVSLLVFTW